MPISVREMSEEDLLAESRIMINENLIALAAGYNKLEALVNPDTGRITNIKFLEIRDGELVSAQTLLDVNGVGRIRGTLLVDGDINAKKLTVLTDLILRDGNIVLDKETQQIQLAGDFKLGGAMIFTEMAQNFIPANLRSFFVSGTTNNLVTDGAGTVLGGRYTPIGRNTITFNWGSYDDTDVALDLDLIYLGTAGIAPGHQIQIISRMGDITNHTFRIHPSTLATPVLDIEYTNGIQFTGNNQVATLLYDGATRWIITSLQGCTVS